MKTIVLFSIIALCLSAVLADETSATENPKERELKERIQHFYPRMGDAKASEFAHFIVTQEEMQVQHHKGNNSRDTFPIQPSGQTITKFRCRTPESSHHRRVNAHSLTPSDIRVIGAFGDSLTAGIGILAPSLEWLFYEYRGVSFSGGQELKVDKVITLGNIIRRFSPFLTGGALGTGGIDSHLAKLNVAVSGSIAQELLGQVDDFIAKLRRTRFVDFKRDWKMVTITTGANNLCIFCDPTYGFLSTGDAFQAAIEAALDKLKAEVPNVFVNLVPFSDITDVASANTDTCRSFHGYYCPCLMFDQLHPMISALAADYAARMSYLATLPKYNTDSFAVVVQPFLSQAKLPRASDGSVDFSYLAPDCFHWSEKAHQTVAVALWNGLFEKVGQKKTSYALEETIYCPKRNQYFATNRNSQ